MQLGILLLAVVVEIEEHHAAAFAFAWFRHGLTPPAHVSARPALPALALGGALQPSVATEHQPNVAVLARLPMTRRTATDGGDKQMLGAE